jgi:hypothetical protein
MHKRALLSLALAASVWIPALAQAPLAPLPALIEASKPGVVLVGTYSPTDSPRFIFRGTGFAPWRLSVAPMMDWTDRHCRYFHRLLTRHALLYTEMVTTGALLHGDVPRHLRLQRRGAPGGAAAGRQRAGRPGALRRLGERGATTRSTSTAAAPASACSAAPSAPA